MSFPRYPEYRESKVQWLGEVPRHWRVKRIKAVASCNDDVLTDMTPGDYEIEYVEISGVDAVHGIVEKTTLAFEYAPSRARRRVTDGDVLVSTVRTYLRAIASVCTPSDNLVVSTGFAVVRPRTVHPGFLSYLIQSEFLIGEIISRSVGVSYPAINASDIMRLHAAFPGSLEEQSGIATFLDRETAKIDALVAEQEKLIELLKEKRQALITHAVTKGLDPNVPMKDSGIPWLGQVPKHWATKRLSQVCMIQPGKAHEPFIDDDGQFICVNSRFVSTEGQSRKFCSQNLTPAKRDDILMVMSDLPNGRALAKAYYVNDNTEYAVNQRVCIIRPKDDNPRFLFYVLNRNPYLLSYDDGINQTHLPNSAFEKFKFLLPPFSEQIAITSFLDHVTTQVVALSNEASSAIELLQERRSALISDAVTGKIDVRDLVMDAAASAQLETA